MDSRFTHWWTENQSWLLSGVVPTVLIGLISIGVAVWLSRRPRSRQRASGEARPGVDARSSTNQNSPIASGSNVAQSVSAPVFNMSFAPAAPTPTSPRETATLVRTLPNIVRTTVRQVWLGRYAQVWGVGSEFDDRGFAATFRNEARRGQQNVGGNVAAHITLMDTDGTEQTGFSGQWMEQESGVAEFRVDATRTLILGLLRAEALCGLENLRINDGYSVSFSSRLHQLNEYSEGIIGVRLTDADRGDVLWEGRFRFTANPISIEPVV